MRAINLTTGQPFEPLTTEYARCNGAATSEHTVITERVVRNRQGDAVILTSALLVEHFEWAMQQPLPAYAHTNPQGAGGTQNGTNCSASARTV